jgi:hypothetical protein
MKPGMKTALSLLLTALPLFPVLSPLSARAATPAHPDRDREFVSACIEAFDRSSSNGSVGIGRRMCECTLKESKSQGVTRAALVSETAKIKADYRYEIKDPRLMAAFRVCAIEEMQAE